MIAGYQRRTPLALEPTMGRLLGPSPACLTSYRRRQEAPQRREAQQCQRADSGLPRHSPPTPCHATQMTDCIALPGRRPTRRLVAAPRGRECRDGKEERRAVLTIPAPLREEMTPVRQRDPSPHEWTRRARSVESRRDWLTCRWAAGIAPRDGSDGSSLARTDVSRP